MNFLSQVFQFLTTGSHWTGPDGFLEQLANQVELSAVAVVAAVVVGVGFGAVLGHRGRGGFVVLNGANAAPAPSPRLPSLCSSPSSPGSWA